MRIDNVLSNLDSSGEAPPLLPQQTTQRVKTCKKRTFNCHCSNLIVDCVKSHSLTAKRQELRHNISRHLGGLARSHFHCVGFLALCLLSAHWCAHIQFHSFFFSLLDHIFLHVSTGRRGVRTAGRGLSLCDVTNLSPAACRKFSCGGLRPSDARCSTPVPARKRRCTMAVDYTEPTLNA